MNEGQCVCMHKYILWTSFFLIKVLLETRWVNKEEGNKKTKKKDIWNSFNHRNSCFLMLCMFWSLPIFLTSLVPGNQFVKDRNWRGLLRKDPLYTKKRYFRMQSYVRREGAKTREDLLKCEYVSPVSVTCYRVYICTCWGEERVWEQGLDRNLTVAFLLVRFLITLEIAASSLLWVLLTFVTADSVALPASQALHTTNVWVWVVCLPLLP